MGGEMVHDDGGGNRGKADGVAILREAIGAFDVKIRSLSDLGIDYRRNERVLVKRRPPLRP